MTVEFNCGNPAGLAGYVYDECEAAERAAIEAHLARCVECATDVAALGATRTALALWTPPDAELGFRVTAARESAVPEGMAEADAHEPARVLRPERWWRRSLPAWAQAAAAVLLFATGGAIGMRTAQQPQQPAPVVQSAPGATAATGSTVTAQDLAALEERLRGEMQRMPQAASTARAVSATTLTDDAIQQRFRALLAESERRQERELALRLAQVVRDVDAQRRMDLAAIEHTFGQMEGVTRPELAQQREMINFLIQRTGLQRAPR